MVQGGRRDGRAGARRRPWEPDVPRARGRSLRQLRGRDKLGRGSGGHVGAQRATCSPRTAEADRVVDSVCPYCAVGCGQKVFVKDEQVVQIEGDPASPISRGRLCPKGSASKQLVTSPEPGDDGPLPRARTAPSGRTSTSTRRWT